MMKRKILSLMVVLCLVVTSMSSLAFGAETAPSYKTAMTKTAQYITKNMKSPGYGDEWNILGLARSGAAVDASMYTTYYNNVVKEVKACKGVLDSRKYTEYSRVILALTAIGKDPKNVGGYNLLEKLADFEQVRWQGINGSIFALIALDSKDYTIPTVKGVKVQTTRDRLIDDILDQQLDDGGFALSGTAADPDMTGMALQALAGYTGRSEVKKAVDRALECVSDMQKADGGFTSWGTKNVESNCQIIVGLTALGINPAKDSRFIRNGKSAIDAMMTYYDSATGGFRHVNTASGGYQPVVNGMATEQAYYTMTAYDRLLNGKSSLYDMTDGKPVTVTKPAAVKISSAVSSKTKTVTVKWKRVSSAKGYQIRYATNSKFSGYKYVTITSNSSATNKSKTLTKLTKGKYYYVKVRAYKTDAKGNKVYGNFSTVKKVKVK